MSFENKRPILFQLRLLLLQFGKIPTGLYRVELQYAYWLLQEKSRGRQVVFFSQSENVIKKVNDSLAEKIILYMWEKWVKGTINGTFENTIKKQIRAFCVKRSIQRLCRIKVDSAIFKNIRSNLTPAYLSSFLSKPNDEYYDVLRDRYKVHFYFYLHDLMPITNPEFFPFIANQYPAQMKMIAKRSNIIFVNSKETAKNFSLFCKQNNLGIPKLIHLQLGVDEQFLQPQVMPSQEQYNGLLPNHIIKMLGNHPYFVAVGTIQPRRNYAMLLNVWREIVLNWHEPGHNCPKLIIVGITGWNCEDVTNILQNASILRNYVIQCDYLNDKQLIELLSNANALLMPTFAEGWGMPVAEALTLKTPVICSDLPVLRECGQNLALYINPIDGLAWKKAIISHATVSKKTLNYRPNLWSDHFKKLDQILDVIF